MTTNEIRTDNRKVNIGLRVYPEVKSKLSEKAAIIGITLSEYTESIILNNDHLLNEKANLEKQIIELKKLIEEKDEIISEFNSTASQLQKEYYGLKDDFASLKSENVKLNQTIIREKIISNQLSDQLKLEIEKNKEFNSSKSSSTIDKTLNVCIIEDLFDGID
jgi:hypothetical protein